MTITTDAELAAAMAEIDRLVRLAPQEPADIERLAELANEVVAYEEERCQEEDDDAP